MTRSKGSKNRVKRERPIPRRSSFTLPVIGGAEVFHDLVQDYGGPAMVSRDFKLSRDLIAKYSSGELNVPYVTMLALWWQSWRGFDQAFSETHNTHMHNFEMRRRAELERYILAKVVQRAIDLLPGDHPIGEMLALGLHKARNPPPLTQLQMEFMEPSIAGKARFPFITAEVATRMECKLRDAGLLPPGDPAPEFLISHT